VFLFYVRQGYANGVGVNSGTPRRREVAVWGRFDTCAAAHDTLLAENARLGSET
jgi:hypothetical protein